MHLEARTIAFDRFKRPWMMSSGVSFARSVGIWSQPSSPIMLKSNCAHFPTKRNRRKARDDVFKTCNRHLEMSDAPLNTPKNDELLGSEFAN